MKIIKSHKNNMNVIDITLKYYPKMAKRGFVFATNICKKRDITFCVKDFKQRQLETYKHFESVDVVIKPKLPAYWQDGTKDKRIVPVFVKVTNPDTLSALSI